METGADLNPSRTGEDDAGQLVLFATLEPIQLPLFDTTTPDAPY